MILIALTFVIAAFVAFTRSASAAFLDVYIPVLLLFPDYYRWILPGLPDPTFSEAALLPIAAVFLIKNRSLWRFSATDLLIIAFAFVIAYSEFLNAGFADAQNLIFDMLGTVVLPYVLAKALIEPCGARIAFARRIVLILFLVAAAGLYEFRFGATPWQIVLGRFFPYQGDGWVTTFRWGVARVAGPYGHAILAGVVMAIGFRMQRWLEWTGGSESFPAWLPAFGFPKARLLMLGLTAGLLMTMVRGPWIAAICGSALTFSGRAVNRSRALRLLFGAVLVFGIPAAIALYSYASVGRAAAKSESQETAAYRKELIDKYIAVALEKAVWGWGRNGWPKVEGMPSIDNYYLLLALMHGVMALALLAALLVSMPVRLLRFALRQPPPLRRGASLAFTLAAIYVIIGVSIGTVYMGLQLVPLFALITGWSEGYLMAGDGEGEPVTNVRPQYAFQRVVA